MGRRDRVVCPRAYYVVDKSQMSADARAISETLGNHIDNPKRLQARPGGLVSH